MKPKPISGKMAHRLESMHNGSGYEYMNTLCTVFFLQTPLNIFRYNIHPE